MKLPPARLHPLSSENVKVLLLMTVVFVLASMPLVDTDLWWHLRTGQYIWDTRNIPYTDLFSIFRLGSEWVAHEWLAEVITYSIFRFAGNAGLIGVFALVVTISFLLVYQRARLRSAHPYVVLLAILLGVYASYPTWGVRPHVLSFLFASIYLSLLERFNREDKIASLWWLVPLQIVWANLHAGYVIGLVLIFLTAIGVIADSLFSATTDSGAWKKVKNLCLILILCSVVVLINPNGTRLFSYPFETLTSPAMMQFIQEWRSPNFHEARFYGLALLLLATACSFGLSRKRVRISDLIMFAAFGWATLKSARNVWIFTLIALPILAENLSTWLSGYEVMQRFVKDGSDKPKQQTSIKTLASLVLLIACLAFGALAVKRATAVQPLVEAHQFPLSGIDYVRKNNLAQPLFNEYDWGGYLIWKAYPDYRVYIDGRADVYGDEFLTEYFRARDGKPGWKEIIERRGVRTIFLKPDTALTTLVRMDQDNWLNVFEDHSVVVFVRR